MRLTFLHVPNMLFSEIYIKYRYVCSKFNNNAIVSSFCKKKNRVVYEEDNVKVKCNCDKNKSRAIFAHIPRVKLQKIVHNYLNQR